ncbi:MAG: response regulator [Acidobacteriota bacterium]
MRKLGRDPFLWLAVLLIATPLVLYSASAVADSSATLWAGHLADPSFLILTVVTLWMSRRDTASTEERVFWRLVLWTCGLWLVGSLGCFILAFTVPEFDSTTLTDLIFLSSYVTLILAADMRPHLPAGWSKRSSGFRFSVAASMLFVSMLALYFFALPYLRVSGAVGELSTQSTFLALDTLLTIRFVHLAGTARRTPWRPIYVFLAISCAAAAVGDGLTVATITGSVSLNYGTALDAIWWLPFVSIVVARRWRTTQVDEAAIAQAAIDDEPRTDAIALILLYAFSFTAAHLLLETGGIMPANTHGLRQVLVLSSLLAFAVLAWMQQLVLERNNRELRSQIRVLVTNEQVVQSQKLEAIGRLAGGLAHDFNNLLTVVSARADMLLGTLPQGDPDWKNAEAILQSSERGAELTKKLLSFSRSQVLKTRSLDLNVLVTDAQTVLMRLAGERFTLETELEPGLPPIESESSQVFQVLLNLVANARDAMPSGGRIVIRTCRLELAANEAEFTPPPAGGSFAALEVIDTGEGIDTATQRRLFEPFFSSKFGGTGLGLAIVYGIVVQGGGHIRVRSDVGRGSRFTTLFPFSGQPVAGVDAVVPTSNGQSRGKRRVLLVDDQEMVRHAVSELLRFLGYEVTTASGGIEALAICSDPTNPFDLLLTDVVMPGMRGPELAAKLRAMHHRIAVIYMSGFAENDGDEELNDDATTYFIGKPFTLETLRVKLNEALGPAPSAEPMRGDSQSVTS